MVPVLRSLADSPDRAAEIDINKGCLDVFEVRFPNKGTLVIPTFGKPAGMRFFLLLKVLGTFVGVLAKVTKGWIPACSDRPPIMNMKLVEWSENRENTVYRSKAIGESPFNLANSVFKAYVDAVSSLGDYMHLPDLDTPATPERILAACDELRKQSSLPD